MPKATRTILWVFLALVFASSGLSAAADGFRGMITDQEGKPVRGAMVKATAGFKTVARFSQANGRYDLMLPPGTYSLSVDAFGFAGKRLAKDASQAGDTNFSLTPKLDLTRMTGADLENLLPDNQETRLITRGCIECHSIENILHKTGSTASEWESFFPTMTRGRLVGPKPSPAVLASLEKYFGPNSPYFGPDSDPPSVGQLKHVEMSDAALNSTIREYAIPTGLPSVPHSIMADSNGDAWFSERGLGIYKIGRFEAGPEKFDEYNVPIPENSTGNPHTGVVARDGSVWMSLIHDTKDSKGPDLAQVDPETGKVITYTIPDSIKHLGAHTLALDGTGNVWMSGSSIWKFDIKTKEFKEYKVKLPTTEANGRVIGDSRVTFYDIKVDSKGMVWASEAFLGWLYRIDPTTGDTQDFHAPETELMRGIDIDAQDNIWFSGFHSNILGKLDQKTGHFSIYHPPTHFATPYGVTVDKRTGNVWYGDVNGQHVTRFEPKTEQFTEFPLPLSRPKFIGVDPKGRIWYTDWLLGKIGVVETGEATKTASAR